MLERFKELQALLLVNLVGDDDRSCDHVPVVEQDTKVALHGHLCIAKSLNAICILHYLSLEYRLSSFIDTLQDDYVSGI